MKIETKLLESKTLIDSLFDLNYLIDDATDIISLNNVNVKGTIYRKYDEVTFNLTVTLEVVQKCTYTLKPVTYPLSFDTEILFSNDLEIYDYVPIDIIDLDEVIFAEILLHKEPNVYHESANPSDFEEPKKTHPAFNSLKEKYKD
ncbi:hypothetical protein IY230_01930 [Acholeplasma laidlawii]|uniref:YceD family protein n=1 Tax=Acholeplasma laidlawii TaxID=2148 RepID=UPI0018C29EA7|nr:hypothetical protein [Acholeplasma laidlawii]MBG0762370.1 hypothetical protein [Acholeplasma laidlawii]